jgi:hypothetical protein
MGTERGCGDVLDGEGLWGGTGRGTMGQCCGEGLWWQCCGINTIVTILPPYPSSSPTISPPVSTLLPPFSAFVLVRVIGMIGKDRHEHRLGVFSKNNAHVRKPGIY